MVDFTEEQKAEIEKLKNEAIAKAVAEKETELKKQHNDEMAKQRKKADEDKAEAVRKAEENAKLSAEEKAKKELEEKQKAEHEELEKLRFEKKINDRKAKLVEAGVPDMFANDNRLINADDDKVEETIKTIKAEWEKISPQGANTNTNVNGANGGGNTNDKFAEFRGLGIGRR